MEVFDTQELDNRLHIHDRLISIALGRGNGIGVRPQLSSDGMRACIRIAQMVIRGASRFTPYELGKPFGWSYERSKRAIDELINAETIQQVTCSDGKWVRCYDRVLNSTSITLHGGDGSEHVTYFIGTLASALDGWRWPDGEL